MENQTNQTNTKLPVPVADPTAFIARGAVVMGNVTLEADVSIWYNATVRGYENSILIGEGSNVQDNAVLHVDKNYKVSIGKQVTIGHSAVVHSCKIDDYTLVGIGAIILNGAVIGKNCIIGAGALITQGTVIPDNSLVLGSPGKVIRQVTEEEAKANVNNALHYVQKAQIYKQMEKEALLSSPI